MTTSQPPRRTKSPSRPSKAPARHSKKPAPKRPTQEVEIDWLEPEMQEALKNARQKGPPPLPGADVYVPPMPVHPSLSPKAFPKPIPREDEDSPPPRKSSRPSRAPKKR